MQQLCQLQQQHFLKAPLPPIQLLCVRQQLLPITVCHLCWFAHSRQFLVLYLVNTMMFSTDGLLLHTYFTLDSRAL
jgi:hypothetical protein